MPLCLSPCQGVVGGAALRVTQLLSWQLVNRDGISPLLSLSGVCSLALRAGSRLSMFLRNTVHGHWTVGHVNSACLLDNLFLRYQITWSFEYRNSQALWGKVNMELANCVNTGNNHVPIPDLFLMWFNECYYQIEKLSHRENTLQLHCPAPQRSRAGTEHTSLCPSMGLYITLSILIIILSMRFGCESKSTLSGLFWSILARLRLSVTCHHRKKLIRSGDDLSWLPGPVHCWPPTQSIESQGNCFLIEYWNSPWETTMNSIPC